MNKPREQLSQNLDYKTFLYQRIKSIFIAQILKNRFLIMKQFVMFDLIKRISNFEYEIERVMGH